jgi:hypothetical protein
LGFAVIELFILSGMHDKFDDYSTADKVFYWDVLCQQLDEMCDIFDGSLDGNVIKAIIWYLDEFLRQWEFLDNILRWGVFSKIFFSGWPAKLVILGTILVLVI